ncbi:hypothetical protein P3G55_03635 [Leptospira sp. 96542]|nr:hypothetical protein [Leptospira sp. 96542]
MQNIDYSRRLRGGRNLEGEFTPSSFPQLGHSSTGGKPKSAFILLIGAILLFTSGMVVGIQLGQKESGFKAQSDGARFSNLGKPKTNESFSSKPESQNQNSGLEDLGATPSQSNSPFPSALKFPPKNDQINYMVQIGDFTPEESVSVGKDLIEKNPTLRGRIFRTSTGKLFAGYFYRMEDAKEVLDSLKAKFPELNEAQVKTIRF